jgi:hypothetical protein
VSLLRVAIPDEKSPNYVDLCTSTGACFVNLRVLAGWSGPIGGHSGLRAKIRASCAHKKLNNLWKINTKQQDFPQDTQDDTLYQGFWHVSTLDRSRLGVLKPAAFQFFLDGASGNHQRIVPGRVKLRVVISQSQRYATSISNESLLHSIQSRT